MNPIGGVSANESRLPADEFKQQPNNIVKNKKVLLSLLVR
ncbi:hypothetical protein HMPREF0973_02881 [Prevotella veroralis F0319]|uniref:Uncharacterized protein n=1 Tax=Prevotella veroralis F0319 TaxID=649761 RepID=C9MTB1_9BACT|nr:hypothetical protein HMPREF0973_02881 [Prevotella veroralis F0319]